MATITTAFGSRAGVGGDDGEHARLGPAPHLQVQRRREDGDDAGRAARRVQQRPQREARGARGGRAPARPGREPDRVADECGH
ncbi:hypothetical protein LUX57_46585 [Actinomadura madurae]|uniref:hypothetical protein n=1 Tax=Actinomadura madurae TaxID=1993 RepID=UPI0020D25916|nr:hypothetical protein [Actinomadura madurae]MCP9971658.1 hypothetical protein [Actinomadura madurae]